MTPTSEHMTEARDATMSCGAGLRGQAAAMSIASCLLAVCTLACRISLAADWPAYQHDVARSAVTSEDLKLPLSGDWTRKQRHAPVPAWEDPKPVPIEGYLETPRLRFDDAFHVVVANGRLYFGSSADNKVYCLDAATGRERWSVITGGPIRFAPQVWQAKVYVPSDDGFVYCLNASDGALVWKFHAAPQDERLLGNGRMISRWPLRTGVLVDDGVAYCTAGIFPSEGAYVYALRADDGKVIWQRDTEDMVLQGYLLASPTTLFAPMGRVSPCGLDRRTGKVVMGRPNFGKGTGGSYALFADGAVFSGSQQLMGYRPEPKPAGVAWFPGRRLVVTPDVSYMASDTEIWAIDRKSYAAKSMALRSAIGRHKGTGGKLKRKLRPLKSKHKAIAAAIEQDQAALAELRKQAKPWSDSAKKQMGETERKIADQSRQLKIVKKRTAGIDAQIAKLAVSEREAHATLVTTCVKWRIATDTHEAMILAGRTIFAGGKGKVVGIDAGTGEEVWSTEVDGKARSLAVASGGLFVSTDTGAIYCCTPDGPAQPTQVRPPANPSPYPKDELTPVFGAAAEAILRQTGITRGYCLVLGCGTGRLALELARRTDLMIYGVEADGGKVELARKALDAAGVYGARVCVDQWPLARVPYADYFANLVVSETALTSGQMPSGAHEAWRMLRPLGGQICIGQPPEAKGVARPVGAIALRSWAQGAGMETMDVTQQRGAWLRVVRGRLPGTTDWTNQYADAGNTACSMDQQVRSPLGVLWFGGPGPGKMVNRHASAAAPLCVDGRLLVQGENVLMAYDAYNGLKLWEREVPGAMRTGLKVESGNLAAHGGSLFAAVKDKCLRVDPATGRTTAVYEMPASTDSQPRKWGYLASTDSMLVGSMSSYGRTSHTLFGIDLATDKRQWVHRGTSIQHIAIAAGDGRVFFVDSSLAEERQRAARRGKTPPRDVRQITALDVRTGKVRWTRPVDVTDCVKVGKGGGELTVMYRDGALFLCGQPANGHFWDEFLAGDFSRRSVISLSAEDGKEVWSGKLGYRSRPIAMADTLIGEPWAYDLHTGKAKTRVSPVTGLEEKWQMARPGHHCGPMVASANTIFCRSGVIAYYDLAGDHGTTHFTGQRPGCHVNFIPANGLLLVPEASSGCMCAFPSMCTVVFKQRPGGSVWGRYSLAGAMKPVKHMAINFGAPGDRKDSRGTLWLAYPRPSTDELIRFRRPGGWLDLPLSFHESILPGGGFFRRNPDLATVGRTDSLWLFSSGCVGLARCTIPLVGEGQAPGVYTVRLSFVEPTHDRRGQRVFGIKLQGKTVANAFDVCSAAEGRNRAVTREFKGVAVSDALRVELVSELKDPKPEQSPIISAMEVQRTRTLRACVTAPTFHVGDYGPRQTCDVTVTNYGHDEFVGVLRVDCPAAMRVTPRETPVRIAVKGKAKVTLTASVATKGDPQDYSMSLRLFGQDAAVAFEQTGTIRYAGSAREVVVYAIGDAHVPKRSPKSNYGTGRTLMHDGGGGELRDSGHSLVYLKFALDVPGRVASLKLRLRVSDARAMGSHDAGDIYLVTGDWDEKSITYARQPELGERIGKLGKIAAGELVERSLRVPAHEMKMIGLALVPTTPDGTRFMSRESGDGPALIVELAGSR